MNVEIDNQVFKDRIIQSLDRALNNISWIINNINTVTYSDYLTAMSYASAEIENANKLGLAAGLPEDIRSELQVLSSGIKKFIESAATTPSLITPEITFETLQGSYRVEVAVAYYGISNPPQSLDVNVGIIVKVDVMVYLEQR